MALKREKLNNLPPFLELNNPLPLGFITGKERLENVKPGPSLPKVGNLSKFPKLGRMEWK